MDQQAIINNLARNRRVFRELLEHVPTDEFLWRPGPEKWCLLEIVCHLRDEEQEDFRARVRSTLEDPNRSWTPFDPLAWVSERHYLRQDYNSCVTAFLQARQESLDWLEGLETPDWDNTFQHRSLGPFSAAKMLANWLAHDYLHIRQINRLRFAYLQFVSGEDLSYAGNW